jgi:hypothetical protein
MTTETRTITRGLEALDAYCAEYSGFLDILAGGALHLSDEDREQLGDCMARCSRSAAILLTTLRRTQRSFPNG